MRYLVTGGAGFIGSHVVDSLLGDGHDVAALDNFDTFYDPAIKRRNISGALSSPHFTLVEGDIRDEGTLSTVFATGHFDAVVHLAARAGVRPSIEHPELYYDVNVTGSLRLLEAMRHAGCRRLVFASSSSVYGNNKKVPFEETDIVDHPISPYAATKKAGELLAHTYHVLHGFDVFCLRFFTVYGPRQRPEMAIHQFLRNVRDGRLITVFGDGSTKRDYTFISDIVAGVRASIERVKGFEVINLGESKTIAMRELLAAIAIVTGREPVIARRPIQAGDVDVTYASVEKANRLLGYNPKTSLNEGLTVFLNWMITQEEKFRNV